MARIIVEEAEALIDQALPVLDKGFVRLVDYMGSDARIVQAARVSYGAGTKTVRQDRGLINYLMKHSHTSPFEQVQLTFHVKLPIFVARQWIRHRTARLNEISARYSVMEDEFYLPQAEDIRFQNADNKQGRSDEEVPAELRQRVVDLLKEDQVATYSHYQELIEKKIARELSRISLPVSLYTQWYWQTDLHNLFHFLRLRMDKHAQLEIRRYAEVMAKMAKAVAPLAYEAFEEHSLHAVKFSRREMEALRLMLKGEANPLEGKELTEFEQKLAIDSRPA